VSTSGITSSLLSQIAGSPSSLNQFVTDFNQLAEDLQSGNLSAAQEDYVTLSEDALNGVTSATTSTSSSGLTATLLSDVTSSQSSETSFVSELNQLGSDLENGDLTSSQEDLLNLDSTALNAASTAGASSTTTSAATSSATTSANQAEIKQLVASVAEAMEFGDSSMVSTAMSQLASIASSPQGASALEQYSSSLSAGGSSGSISQLLQSSSGNTSSSSASILDAIA
jgi:hypothetical protein